MRGRQASESILIVNEVCHSLKGEKTKGLILKLDFEKAFDSVNWEFLFQAFKRFGLGSKMIRWIKNYYTEARMSILIIVSLTPEFSPSRCLRQGDPLFSNLVAEILSTLIKQATQENSFKCIKIVEEDNMVTRVQFADDTLIFINNDVNFIRIIKRILTCFQLLSGLKSNFFKSKLY